MQLTIFDVVDNQSNFRFGEPVQVVDATNNMDAETYFYLQSFEGEKGLVVKVIKHPSLQYEVDFNGTIGIVYHNELEGLK